MPGGAGFLPSTVSEISSPTLRLFGDLFWNILSIVHDKPHGSVHSVHRPVIMVGEQFPHLPDDHAWGLIHRCCRCKFPVIPLHAKSITLFLFGGYLFWNIL